MKRAEYRSLLTGQGAQLRNLYLGATNRGLPSRSEVYERISEMGVEDSAVRTRIVDRVIALARKAQADGVSRLRLHAEADQMALKTLREFVAADDLLGRDTLHGEEREDELIEADRLATREAGRIARKLSAGWSDEELERREAADVERDRLRGLGLKVQG